MSKKETFQSNLAEIDEIIIECEKNGNKEFSDKIKEKLNNIFRSYASEVYFDDGLDTIYSNYDVGKVFNLAKALSSGNEVQQEYSYAVFREIAKLYNAIVTNLPK